MKNKLGSEDSSRRQFLKAASLSAMATALGDRHSLAAQQYPVLAQAMPKPAAQAGSPDKRFIAMQISAQSFVDEGVDKCLDTLQEKGGVNVIMPVAYSYGWELDGRQVHERPLPDHGVQAYDEIHGGSYTAVHPDFYRDSPIFDGLRAPDLGNLIVSPM